MSSVIGVAMYFGLSLLLVFRAGWIELAGMLVFHFRVVLHFLNHDRKDQVAVPLSFPICVDCN